MSLNPRQELFCGYVADGASFAAAARRAGYAAKSSRERGSELMANEAVKRRVEELKAGRTAADSAAFDQMVAWLVHMIRHGVKSGQMRYVDNGIRHLLRLAAMRDRLALRLPPEVAEQAAQEIVDEALLASVRETPAEPPPAAAAETAPAPLNRHQRRALRRLRRK